MTFFILRQLLFDSDFVICDYSFVKFIYNEFKFSYNVGYKIVP